MFTVTLYLLAGIIIYIFVGPEVPSPALSAAGSLVVRKIIWGIAIPSMFITSNLKTPLLRTFSVLTNP